MSADSGSDNGPESEIEERTPPPSPKILKQSVLNFFPASYLRTTMSQARLNHAMSLYVHKDRTDKIDLDEIANSFLDVTERRRNYFGHV